jgi:hypothetical protein
MGIILNALNGRFTVEIFREEEKMRLVGVFGSGLKKEIEIPIDILEESLKAENNEIYIGEDNAHKWVGIQFIRWRGIPEARIFFPTHPTLLGNEPELIAVNREELINELNRLLGPKL